MEWEYRHVAGSAHKKGLEELTDELDVLGRDGWEAIGFTSSSQATLNVLLKRPVAG